ncbi:transmembrane 9 superfamily member 4-like [Umbelopsis sp. PMI_123]|nr:transmembrane 9 superfamily member 4-like [Umbelopsis sp. PMI_123]
MKERPKPMWAVLIIYAQLIALVNATGLFSTSPTILNKGDPIPLYLNKVFSFKTQLPYAYNELSFICPTSARASRPWINLGQVMRGDRIIESDYKITVGRDSSCQVLCDKPVTVEEAMQAKKLILQDYQVEWILDDMPSSTAFYTSEVKTKRYRNGFPLGQVINGKTYLNNHIALNILYDTVDQDRIRIVGFEIYPDSFRGDECQPSTIDYDRQEVSERRTTIRYSYSVTWELNKQISWEQRWEMYLLASDNSLHWYAIINSMVIVLFMSAILAVILMKAARKDVTDDDKLYSNNDEALSWKLINKDVFRRPTYGGLFAPLLGSGIQLLTMAVPTLQLAYLGILNRTHRGGIVSFALTMYLLGGSVAGYSSARIYKVFKGRSWQLNAVLTATLVPAVLFITATIINLFVWTKQSSWAMPFTTWLSLIFMWVLVCLPLVMIGAYYGDKQPRLEHPVRVNPVPRIIPYKPWYLSTWISMAAGGALPFAVVFMEVHFLLKSIWQGQMYGSFYFLEIVFVILVITIVEVTIALVYFQLCSEDYNWWWRSFVVSGAAGIYVFCYTIAYWITVLEIDGFVAGLAYVANAFLISLAFGVCTGTIGFFAAYLFVRRLYSSLKVD